jgi:hypothetical protein
MTALLLFLLRVSLSGSLCLQRSGWYIFPALAMVRPQSQGLRPGLPGPSGKLGICGVAVEMMRTFPVEGAAPVSLSLGGERVGVRVAALAPPVHSKTQCCANWAQGGSCLGAFQVHSAASALRQIRATSSREKAGS